MGKILSIIVPAYNVERYLERCLASFEVTSVMEKIEVLVINDGSKDQTAEIAEKYCLKYPESYFLYNKENGGHGSGINYGIKYATGKYFKVVDGDDWLNREEMEEFIRLLEQTDADVVAADYLCIEDGTERMLQEKYCTRKKEQYGNTANMDAGEVENVIKMHALTIKTDILKKYAISIDEHCYYVDCEYITYPMPYVKTVYFYNRFIYMYRLGRNGQSMDIRSMQKNRAQHMHVIESLLKFYDDLGNVSAENKHYIEKCIAQVVENQFQIYLSMGKQAGIKEEMKSFDGKLKEKYPGVYRAVTKKSIWMLRKSRYSLFGAGTVVYRTCKKGIANRKSVRYNEN